MSWGTNALFAVGGAAAAFAIVKMTSRVPEGAIEISGLGDLHRPWNPLHAPNTGPHRPPRRRRRWRKRGMTNAVRIGSLPVMDVTAFGGSTTF